MGEEEEEKREKAPDYNNDDEGKKGKISILTTTDLHWQRHNICRFKPYFCTLPCI